MHRVINQFQHNIANVRSLGGLFEALDGLTTPALDAADLLRAQVVMAVSALDHFVHELAVTGMLEIYTGVRSATTAYLKFQIPMRAAVPGITGGTTAWFEAIVREKHGFLSFQQPDRIADAVRLFSPCELWPDVATAMGMTSEATKTRLRLVVERRNKIAHEADLDPSYPGVRWPITPTDSSGVVDYVEQVCQHIHATVV
ncbi:MAG: HEPN domain-containing protein [Planctomycetota bacterium]|nr:HEPN domain-containing protein [Planctomycetota bacterium]